MKIFIAKDGSEPYYNSEEYFSLLEIDYEIFNCEPNISKKQIAKKIFSKTKCERMLILKENEIISSYQIDEILKLAPENAQSIIFPKIRYEYKIENNKKVFNFNFCDFPETHPSNLWDIDKLKKTINIIYEECFFNVLFNQETSIIANNTKCLIFEFVKTK